ncbi:MAG: hypothetical protein ABI576_18370 [Flavobacterium sp.]
MERKILVKYDKSIENLIDKVKFLAKTNNITFTHNNQSGIFNGTIPFGKFEGSYIINNNLITIKFTKKPIFIPLKIIENEITKFLKTN